MAALERHWNRITPVSLLLWPLSLLFCGLVRLRRQVYRLGVLRSHRLPRPVIVVGNITVGGTGKTPLALWLVEQLKQAGYRPGIVTRGYRGASRHWPLDVSPATPAAEAGDEAVLLARRSGCPVVAGPDRVASGRRLAGQGCNVIVSDDGLQHYRLARDIEIVVIDGERRFGNGLCLPAGPLREPVARLRQLPLRVTHGNPQAGETGMRLVPEGFYRLAAPDTRVPAGYFQGEPVHAVAGIGHPQRFFATLRDLGLSVTPHPFPDHHPFRPADLDFGDDRPVLMTEKDAVKCQNFAGPNTWALAVHAEPAAGLAGTILRRLKEIAVGQETA
jgi:tetraacyldisaccharide 4'-kinase